MFVWEWHKTVADSDGDIDRKELTIPPSRAKANIIRLLLVILNRPQCQTHTRRRQHSHAEPRVVTTGTYP